MARRPRFAPAGLPVHATHRGNFRQRIFFSDADRRYYLDLIARHAPERGVRILGHCLMANHTHLVAIPETDCALSDFFARLSGEYAQYLNGRLGRRGHLWGARFYCCLLDAPHLGRALRYVDLNPVRAGRTARAEDYRWSSAAAHLGLTPPPEWLDLAAFRERFEAEHWRWALGSEQPRAEIAALRGATRLERPLASEEFVRDLEARYDVQLLARSPGRRKSAQERLRAVGASPQAESSICRTGV